MMKRIARGRWLLVATVLVVTLALAGCGAEVPLGLKCCT